MGYVDTLSESLFTEAEAMAFQGLENMHNLHHPRDI